MASNVIRRLPLRLARTGLVLMVAASMLAAQVTTAAQSPNAAPNAAPTDQHAVAESSPAPRAAIGQARADQSQEAQNLGVHKRRRVIAIVVAAVAVVIGVVLLRRGNNGRCGNCTNV